MADEKDKRIGTLDANGAVLTWPLTNFTGGSYSQPASRHNLDATRFVVLPMNFTAWDELQAFKGGAPFQSDTQVSEEVPAEPPSKRK